MVTSAKGDSLQCFLIPKVNHQVRVLVDHNQNPNLVVDLRNKEILNSFSYVHVVRPFRNSDY